MLAEPRECRDLDAVAASGETQVALERDVVAAALEPQVLQYKPGILMTPQLCEEMLDRTELAIGRARDQLRAEGLLGDPVPA